MIDIQTYKTLHPDSTLAHSQLISDFPPEVMAQGRPPEGDSYYCSRQAFRVTIYASRSGVGSIKYCWFLRLIENNRGP